MRIKYIFLYEKPSSEDPETNKSSLKNIKDIKNSLQKKNEGRSVVNCVEVYPTQAIKWTLGTSYRPLRRHFCG